MKVRNGFVSNSSSSSFVVKLKEDWVDARVKNHTTPETLLTPEQVSVLESMQFQYCAHTYASRVEQLNRDDECLEAQDKTTAPMMALSICCNQDEFIEALVRNEIPFTAACHYGHETVVWRAGDEFVYVLHNAGVAYETYQMQETLDAEFKARKVSVADIKENGFY